MKLRKKNSGVNSLTNSWCSPLTVLGRLNFARSSLRLPPHNKSVMYKEVSIMKSLSVILLFLSLSISGKLFADSDGMFCATKDYVAIQASGIYIPASEPVWIVVPLINGEIGERQLISSKQFGQSYFDCRKYRLIFDGGKVSGIKQDASIVSDILRDGQLPYIETSSVSELLKSDTGGYIALITSVARDSKVESGAGPIIHHFSLRVAQLTYYQTIVSSVEVASGARHQTIH
jgi:hypothetical protein